MDIVHIPLKQIDEDTAQPRYQFDEEALRELMDSIAELGLLSPIKVRPVGDRYKIIYGNRRYKASVMLGRETIPCIVSNITDESDIYLEQIAENLTREGFTPVEEAEAFHKLMNDARFSMSVKLLSSKLGKPESYIRNKCELLKFGAPVRKLVVAGTEVRKDKLIEGQLLPLKDLPSEYADPLALIFARDEVWISDAKKIAKLFKDPSLSAGTKEKLLYKTGRELLETWSVFEANRAERAKQAETKAEAEARKREREAEAGDDAADGGANADAAASAGVGADAANEAAAATAGAEAGSGVSAASADAPGQASADAGATPIEAELRQLLGALDGRGPLSQDAIVSLQQVSAAHETHFLAEVDRLVAVLEGHLADWRRVRETARGSADSV